MNMMPKLEPSSATQVTPDKTLAAPILPTSQMSVGELSFVYEHLNSIKTVILGALNSPLAGERQSFFADYNAGGQFFEELADEVISRWMDMLAVEAVGRKDLRAEDERERAYLVIQHDVACGEGLPEMAAKVAEFVGSTDTSDEHLQDLQAKFEEARHEFDTLADAHNKCEGAYFKARPDEPKDLPAPTEIDEALDNLTVSEFRDSNHPTMQQWNELQCENGKRRSAWRAECERLRRQLHVDESEQAMQVALDRCDEIAGQIYQTNVNSLEGIRIKRELWGSWSKGIESPDLLQVIMDDLERISVR